MTAQQKALHLFEEYYNRLTFVDENRRRYEAKSCALICVHEMYSVAVKSGNEIMIKYLKNVKKEIDRL